MAVARPAQDAAGHPLLDEVLGRIRRDYVDGVTETTFDEAAVKGILANLDPHSAFLDARQYDEMRPQFGGVAAAGLEGARCQGCHLDLSAGELDVVRAAAAGSAGVTECPNCGRLLVVG